MNLHELTTILNEVADDHVATITLSRSEPGQVILHGMTHRVGPKGQVVIPKELRVELGIEPGDEVSFWRHDDHVAVRPADQRRPLRGRFSRSALVDELVTERTADREREDVR